MSRFSLERGEGPCKSASEAGRVVGACRSSAKARNVGFTGFHYAPCCPLALVMREKLHRAGQGVLDYFCDVGVILFWFIFRLAIFGVAIL